MVFSSYFKVILCLFLLLINNYTIFRFSFNYLLVYNRSRLEPIEQLIQWAAVSYLPVSKIFIFTSYRMKKTSKCST